MQARWPVHEPVPELVAAKLEFPKLRIEISFQITRAHQPVDELAKPRVEAMLNREVLSRVT